MSHDTDPVQANLPSLAPAAPASPRRTAASWVVIVLLALLSVGFFVRVGFALADRLAPPPEVVVPPARVEVLEVQPRPFEHTVPIAGTLAPVHSVDVFPKVGGKVIALHVALGQEVRAGDPLATVESVEYEMQARQADVGLDMARQAVGVAERSLDRLDRVRQAAGSMGISDQAYDEAAIQVQGARTQRDVAEAQRDLARRMVMNATMRAPVDGRVSRVDARLGGMVGDSYPAFRVDDTHAFVVRVEVGDLDLPRIVPGQAVRLWPDALPDVELAGTVAGVAPSLDAWTRRAPVEVSVPGGDDRLIGNLFARGEIVVRQDPAALVLPAELVRREGQTRGLVMVEKDGLAAEVEVVVDAADSRALAVQGLVPGDRVIVPGAERLEAGEPVEVVRVRPPDAAAARPGAAG